MRKVSLVLASKMRKVSIVLASKMWKVSLVLASKMRKVWLVLASKMRKVSLVLASKMRKVSLVLASKIWKGQPVSLRLQFSRALSPQKVTSFISPLCQDIWSSRDKFDRRFGLSGEYRNKNSSFWQWKRATLQWNLCVDISISFCSYNHNSFLPGSEFLDEADLIIEPPSHFKNQY